MTNPAGFGLSENTDLLMYQLNTDPLLLMDKTFWDDVATSWTETAKAGSDREGFKWDPDVGEFLEVGCGRATDEDAHWSS
ncbi:hypothetical protein OAG06_03335 [Verrucomicrobia bacterium]|nr:hypothetical protein [Verrucomicrobiota bacterium]